LIERALGAELSHHLGYPPGASKPEPATNHRNGSSNVATTTELLTQLRERLAGARACLRGAAQIDLQVAEILDHYHVGRYLKVRRTVCETHSYKQTRRGRPGKHSAYRRLTRRRYDIDWEIDEAAIAYDQKSDGMYPWLSNDRSLSPAQLLTAHKGQPRIEKRFEPTREMGSENHLAGPTPRSGRSSIDQGAEVSEKGAPYLRFQGHLAELPDTRVEQLFLGHDAPLPF
jgi:hypothetical protein